MAVERLAGDAEIGAQLGYVRPRFAHRGLSKAHLGEHHHERSPAMSGAGEFALELDEAGEDPRAIRGGGIDQGNRIALKVVGLTAVHLAYPRVTDLGRHIYVRSRDGAGSLFNDPDPVT